jgi:hypothetical protein
VSDCADFHRTNTQFEVVAEMLGGDRCGYRASLIVIPDFRKTASAAVSPKSDQAVCWNEKQNSFRY